MPQLMNIPRRPTGRLVRKGQRIASGFRVLGDSGTPVIPPSDIPPVLWWDYAGSGRLPSDHTFTRASTATYVGADGLVKTAEVDEPRFEYDADGNALGLLIEPAGENILWASFDPSDGGGWNNNQSHLIIERNHIGLKAGESAGTAYIQNGAPNIDGPCVCSAHLQAAEQRYGVITLRTYASNTYAIFDLVDGVIVVPPDVGQTNYSAEIKRYGSGFLCSLIAAEGVSPTFSAIVTASPAPNLTTPTVNEGDGIYVWSVQTEVGSVATSHIITTSTAAKTRAADNCTADISAVDLSAQGTVLANFDLLGAAQSNQHAWIMDATLDARLYVNTSGNTLMRTTAGQATIGPYSQPATSVTRTAVADDGATTRATVNSGNIVVAAGTGVTSAVQEISIGQYVNETLQLNGHMKRVQIWDVALDDADLTAITEPDTPPLVSQTSGYVIETPQSPDDSQFIDPDGPGADALEINGAVPSYFGSAGKTTLVLDIDDQGGDVLVQFGSLKQPIRMAFDTTKGGPYIYKGDAVRDVLAAVRGKVVPIKYAVIAG